VMYSLRFFLIDSDLVLSNQFRHYHETNLSIQIFLLLWNNYTFCP
jgi:hypothetical protein